MLPSHILLGWERRRFFSKLHRIKFCGCSRCDSQNQVTEEFDYVATARGRIGYVFGPWLLYGTGGVALMGGRFLNDLPFGEEEKQLRARFGGVVGAGAEYAFDPNWTIRLEYLYGRFANANVGFPSGVNYVSNAGFQHAAAGTQSKAELAGGYGLPNKKMMPQPSRSIGKFSGRRPTSSRVIRASTRLTKAKTASPAMPRRKIPRA